MQCKACGDEVLAGATFCDCGAALSAPAVVEKPTAVSAKPSGGFLKGVMGAVGLGLGTMELELPQMHFTWGDFVRGTVHYELSEPKECKALKVRVCATQTVYRPERDANGRLTTRQEQRMLFDTSVVLSGAQIYERGRVPFEVRLPASPDLANKLPDGLLGDVARVVAFVSSAGAGAVTWEVSTHLEMPWSVGLTKRTPITVA